MLGFTFCIVHSMSFDKCIMTCIHHYSMQQNCHYFMPIADPLLNWFKKLCDNRKKDGMIMVDFKKYCSKNVPSDNMW